MMDKNRTVQKLITLFLSLFLIIGSIGFQPIVADEEPELHTNHEAPGSAYPAGHYYCNDPIIVTASGGEWVAVYKGSDNPKTAQDSYFYAFEADGQPHNIYNETKGNRKFAVTMPTGFDFKIVLFATKGDYSSEIESVTVKGHIDSDPGTASVLSVPESTPEDRPVSITSTSYKRDAWVGIYEGTHSAGDTFGDDYLAKYYLAHVDNIGTDILAFLRETIRLYCSTKPGQAAISQTTMTLS